MAKPHIDAVPQIYDAMAPGYANHAQDSIWNAHYDRPAVLGLLPEIDGKRVLDIGCGPGIYAEWLVEHGATVVGFDISAEMVDVARQRLGDRAVFHQHDVAQPLVFADDGSFDVAVAPLMIHYVTDRVNALREVARVLTDDGVLVLSTQHPFEDWQRHGGSYFETKVVVDTWGRPGSSVEMPLWRLSLTTLCDEFAQAGFYIDRLLEPQPTPAAKAIDPDEYRKLMEQPCFIAFRLRKRNPAA